MIKIGNTTFHNIPRIALVISDKENNEAIKTLRVDILEIRVDQFERFEMDYIRDSVLERKKTGLPLILTVRNAASEGGRSNIPDGDKLKIFQALAGEVDALDIELKSPLLSEVVHLAKENDKRVIVSSHNFKSTPKCPVAEKIFKEAMEKGADIVKIAAQADSMNDVNKLMKFTLKHKNDNIITISLGDMGSLSRLMFPAAGSLLTYSYMDKPSAPGQVPLKVLQEDLRRYYPAYNEHFKE